MTTKERFLVAGLAAVLLLGLGAPVRGQADTDPPVIAVSESGSPLADGSLFGRSVTPVVQVTDESAVTTDLTLDGDPWTSGSTITEEGSHTLVVQATDAAQNSATVTLDFEIDTTPPAFGPLSPAAGAVLAAAEITLTGTVTGAVSVTVDGQAASLTGDQLSAGPFPLVEGERTWQLEAMDAAGNTASLSHSVVRDAMAPTVQIQQPTAGALVAAPGLDVVGRSADLHPGTVRVNGVTAERTGETFIARGLSLAEGENELAAVATDQAGNTAQDTRTVVLDTTAPVITVTDPAPGTVVPEAEIVISGTADDPHLQGVTVAGVTAALTATPAGETFSASVPLAEGVNEITISAVDDLGWSAVAQLTVLRDSDAPAVAIESPEEGVYLRDETVEVRGTVADEAGLTVTVNGLTAQVGAAGFVVDVVPLAEGENRLIARATDSLGNQGVHTRVVYRDTVAPELLFSEPAEGALAVPPDSHFRLTFSEPLASAPAGVSLSTAGGQPLAISVLSSGSELQILPDSELPSGEEVQLLLGTALEDRAGNPLAEERTLVFQTADASAPSPPQLSTSPPGHLCATIVALEGTAEPDAFVEVTGGAARARQTAAADGSFNVEVELLPETLNRLELFAEDRSGNRSPVTAADVVHDCTAPRVTSSSRLTNAIAVEFSEAVLAGSLTGALTVTASADPLTGSVSLEPSGLRAVFTPTSALPAEPLEVEVSVAVQDLAGNSLAYAYSAVLGGGVTASFVSGRVIDQETGRPLPGALVIVTESGGVPNTEPLPQQTTGPDGRFSIPVAAGSHELAIGRSGYTPAVRHVAATAGTGVDVFDPRLTALADASSLDGTGGTAGEAGALELSVPSGALAAATAVSVTLLEEQGLPGRLPYGWSPRGAAWVDLEGEILGTAASLLLPVEEPDGSQLPVARLDLDTLHWQVVALTTVAGGRVDVPVTEEGAYVAVVADDTPFDPPVASIGNPLAAAAPPDPEEILSATFSFDPDVVLPSQRSSVTVTYALDQGVPSGVPLTLRVREELVLLDGTVRRGPPYDADLVLYKSGGTARSRFGLRPSPEAAGLALEAGVEEISIRRYGGEDVAGDVLGPTGGVVLSAAGDRVELPAGALAEATAVSLTRRAAGDLPANLPASTELLGALDLDLGGRSLSGAARLVLELGQAPAAGDRGLLLEAVSVAGEDLYRPVTLLEATASGWATAVVDPQDQDPLPWEEVRREGLYVFVRWTADGGFFHGTVTGPIAAPAPGALVLGDTVEWVQLAADDGAYVLPAPLGAAVLTAFDPATLNEGTGAGSLTQVDEQVVVDLAIQATGPQVVEFVPADGAVDVTPGIEPTVRFSEDVLASSAAAGVRLLRDGLVVPAQVEVQGALVRLLPEATLVPGGEYEVKVNTALKDLQGNPVAGTASATFTILDVQLNDQLNPGRIHLLEPDGAGFARVLGRAGAVPADTLVFVENTTSFASTPSVTANQDGSFTVDVEASLEDTLLLHILVDGGNEIVFELTPFLGRDGRTAFVDERSLTFTTFDDITVTVPEGAFDGPAQVKVTGLPAEASPAPVPADFQRLAAFEIVIAGADAKKGLEISLPEPAGAGTGQDFLLTREYRLLGEPYWMIHALMRPEGGSLTTLPEAFATASLPSSVREEGKLASLAGSTALASLIDSSLGQLQPFAAPATFDDRRGYLPGVYRGGRYTVMVSTSPLDFVAFPVPGGGQEAYFLQLQIEGMAVVADQGNVQRLEQGAVLMATRRDESFSVEGRDLSTGYRFFDDSFDAPSPGDGAELPPSIFADSEAPLLVGASPFLVLPLELGLQVPASGNAVLLAPGISASAQGSTHEVTAGAGAVPSGAAVRWLSLEGSASTQTTAGGDGSFALTLPTGSAGRSLLALGGSISNDEPLVLHFSEAPFLPVDAQGRLRDVEVRDASGRRVAPQVETSANGRALALRPASGWPAGEYTLRLLPTLGDGDGNSWGKTLELPFRARGSRDLGVLAEAGPVRQAERLGSLVFVAADSTGLVVLDASDPGQLRNYIAPGAAFSFPYDDPVEAVAVDPHGRVFVAGGGIASPGQLKILDPLRLVPGDPASLGAALRGSTQVSDPLTGIDTVELPEGLPRRVAVLSDDDVYLWTAPGSLPPEALVTVSTASPPAIAPEQEITVTGAAASASAGLPVTLRNLSRGRWQRADAAADGSYVLTIQARPGDELELRINRQSLAYVAILGGGVAVVDTGVFYGETDTPSNPDGVPQNSDVLGFYSGADDPRLRLCGEAVGDVEGGISGAVLDVGTLFDAEGPHPLVAVSLIGFRGLLLLESDPADVGQMSYLNDLCTEASGSRRVQAMEVIEDYPFAFDRNGDGVAESLEERDYVLVTHLHAGLLVLDATDRDNLSLVGQVPLPGAPAGLSVDRRQRRVYVATADGQVHVVDFDLAPSNSAQDANGDGLDDRILETLPLDAAGGAPPLLLPELAIALGGADDGAHIYAVGGPVLIPVSASATGPELAQALTGLAPLGVPGAPGGEQPASFRVLAHLPGEVGATLTLDVESRGPGRVVLDGTGVSLTGLPPVRLTGADALTLQRLAQNPWEEGYDLFLSDEVVAVADLRAASAYTRTSLENDACTRCDGTAEGVGPGAKEILSGESVAVSFSAAAQAALEPIYGEEALSAAALELPSVRWDLSPSARQEPTLNPSEAQGHAIPGTRLHSGEVTRAATDLAVAGRRLGFAFTRVYRNQATGAGPLGPGWDFTYRQRLRPLPNGDVELFDGTGRRELFALQQDGTLQAPAGRFVDLAATPDGWRLLDAQANQLRFDAHGRLVGMADFVKDSADTGNEISFHYDAASRLVRVVDDLERSYHLSYDGEGRLTELADFDGRKVTYEYDAAGRLERVSSPEVTKGLAQITQPVRLTTVYTYEPVPGSGLPAQLAQRDNLASVTDPRANEVLAFTYTDADGDGRAEESTSQTWGPGTVALAYDFGARTATVTDRGGDVHVFTHNPAGQAVSYTDPATKTWQWTYDEEGLLIGETPPAGPTVAISYGEDCAGQAPAELGRRSRGNRTCLRVTPDGDPNGSPAELATEIAYDSRFNRPTRVTDPRGYVTEIELDQGQPVRVREAVGEPEERSTQTAYNAYGQPTLLTNGEGNQTELRYGTSGPSRGYPVAQITDPGDLALTTRYETDARGNTVAVVDPRGVRHTQEYNELDWLIARVAAVTGSQEGASSALALGYRTEVDYDENGNVVEERLPYGLEGSQVTKTNFTYGPLNELLSQVREIEPGGATVSESYEYDDELLLTEHTKPLGQKTTWTYDSRDLTETVVAAASLPESVTTSFTYDDAGRATVFTDGRSNDWNMVYDGYGRVQKRLDPLSHGTEMAYDANGNLSQVESIAAAAVLAETAFTYDALNRRKEVTRQLWTPAGGPGSAVPVTSTTTYTATDQVATTTDPLGHETLYEYDSADRLRQVTDAAGNVTDLVLDAAGNATQVDVHEVQVEGGTITVTELAAFDALGRQTEAVDGLGNLTRTTYDARNLPRIVRDPEGFVTRSDFDGLNRLLERELPEGIREIFGYDANSRLVNYKDSLGNETTYAYDGLDRRRTTTYPDSTVWTATYDAAHNVATITDANGTVVTQSHDAANRLTGRTVAPASGVIGPTAETYAYDGLNRTTLAASGTVGTARTYDSLSRILEEETAGTSRPVASVHDGASNRTGLAYPSGMDLGTTFDSLHRVATRGPQVPGTGIAPQVTYGYRGFGLEAAKSFGNGITGATSFDGARRAVATAFVSPLGGNQLFNESTAWSPRSLKTAQAYSHQNGRGRLMAYDGAGRLLQQALVPDPLAQVPNNSAPAPGILDSAATATRFAYDAAQNLVSREERDQGVETTVSLPVDASGRNRPASVNGKVLEYDLNGNLTRKGDQRYKYDFRNRLTQVTDLGGTEIAQYAYDADNRRVQRLVGGDTIETVWDGLQALEHYRNGQLETRMTYGNGLDEVIALEVDLDGDGSLEPPLTPIYDASGNLVLLTDESGKPVERITYSPYGDRTIRVDVSPPAVEQLRVVGDELWLEVSEEVLADPLATAFAVGQVRLVEDATSTELTLLSAEQRVKVGRQSGRRIVLTLDTPPAVATGVTLTIEPAALVDSFLNQPAGDFTAGFAWPNADAVLVDTAPPVLQEVSQREGHVEIELSEAIDPSTFAAGLLIDGAPAAWIFDANGYRLRMNDPLTDGSHTIAITTALEDLDGQALTEAYSETITISSATPVQLHYVIPDERITPTSTTGNTLAFHGRPVDEETGFLYFRNRYYDPEMGRFATTDPLGFTDGPNVYAYALNSPVNYSDPLGLEAGPVAIKVKRFYRPIYVRVEPIKSSVAWTEEEIEEQLTTANEILGEKAGVYVFWPYIKQAPGSKESLTERGSKRFLDSAAFGFATGRSDYKGMPIFYVRENSENSAEGGGALRPRFVNDRSRAAYVSRYWRGERTSEYVTAHELGHALGALCHADEFLDPGCRYGAPRPEKGGVMNYASPEDKDQQGEGLTDAEIERLRLNAQILAASPTRADR